MESEAPATLDTERLRQRVNQALDEFLSRQQPMLEKVTADLLPVVEVARTMLAGGKRLRPAFAYWGYRVAGGDDGEQIVTAAASLELLQACALIHDDVMDDSDLRRGQPSVHRRFAALHDAAGWRRSGHTFGIGAAILLGDLALTWADELLFASGLPDQALLRAKPVYDQMRTELMAGQYLDLVEQARGGGSVERALLVARYKSAKYTVEGPLRLGGSLAGGSAELLDVYTAYALPLGEAFQLRDDLLGVFGDPGQTGKPTSDDLREGKRTVLIAIAVERADAAQQRVIERHLGDPVLSEEGVAALRQVIVDTGADTHVETLIDERMAGATAELAGLDANSRKVLSELAHAATSRQG
ncbi:MAG TPA: polyprenyl synthetase family protein [Actinomycetes bacterium]|nr:polyprenyl synthetase family protein [Actinomycetes bacterium]